MVSSAEEIKGKQQNAKSGDKFLQMSLYIESDIWTN